MASWWNFLFNRPEYSIVIALETFKQQLEDVNRNRTSLEHSHVEHIREISALETKATLLARRPESRVAGSHDRTELLMTLHRIKMRREAVERIRPQRDYLLERAMEIERATFGLEGIRSELAVVKTAEHHDRLMARINASLGLVYAKRIDERFERVRDTKTIAGAVVRAGERSAPKVRDDVDDQNEELIAEFMRGLDNPVEAVPVLDSDEPVKTFRRDFADVVMQDFAPP
jgi:hypothetical protein